MEVAQRRGDCTIVCVDSMCVYRGLSIGTAKPTPEDRLRVPHCLVDLVDPDVEFSVAEFQRLARQALAEVASQGRSAILVGGTGLYHRAVIDDFEIPGQYEHIARALMVEADTGGPEALHVRLGELDPVAASRMEPTNTRRIVRALEVTIGSGRAFSSFGPGLESYPSSGIAQIGIAFDRAAVDQAIEQRVHDMIAQGFVAEVEALLSRPTPLARTAARAVGYRQMAQYLDGSISLSQAIDDTITATRQLARRQWSWFKRDPRIAWFERSEVAEHVELVLQASATSARD